MPQKLSPFVFFTNFAKKSTDVHKSFSTVTQIINLPTSPTKDDRTTGTLQNAYKLFLTF